MPRQSLFLEHVLDLLSGLGGVSARAMFGGYGIYRDGVMFALIADEVLYLKVDDQIQGDFAAQGCRPFVYQHKNRSQPTQFSYWEAPVDALERASLLCDWAGRAHEAALRTKASRPAKKAKVSKKSKKSPPRKKGRKGGD